MIHGKYSAENANLCFWVRILGVTHTSDDLDIRQEFLNVLSDKFFNVSKNCLKSRKLRWISTCTDAVKLVYKILSHTHIRVSILRWSFWLVRDKQEFSRISPHIHPLRSLHPFAQRVEIKSLKIYIFERFLFACSQISWLCLMTEPWKIFSWTSDRVNKRFSSKIYRS